MSDLITIAEKYGLQIALVAFFIWRDWMREKYLSQRLDQVQDARTNELAGVIRDNSEAMRSLKGALEDRPCMANGDR
jgi:hypothetical protein